VLIISNKLICFNKQIDLFIQQSYFCGSLTLITFKFACKSIYSFGETLEQESFFSKVLFAAFRPLFGRFAGEELSFVTVDSSIDADDQKQTPLLHCPENDCLCNTIAHF